MGVIDWRTGVFLLGLGLLGLLLPGIEGFAEWDLPAWPFWLLVAAGATLAGLGLYHRLNKRK